MNYLGHLYFSNEDTELMYYNLLGDFVKGSNFKEYSDKEIYGIKLHREIDSYIDSHPSVLELLHLLYKDLPKIAGVAVDLYFDHLLAKNWTNFHAKKLEDFVNDFYNYPIDITKYNNPKYELVITKMQQYNWLKNYQYVEGLERASKGLSNRISFKNDLGKALNIFEKHKVIIESTFHAYMNDAIPYFEEYHRNKN